VTDWQVLAEKLSAKTGRPPGGARATPLAGGDINRAFRLDTGGGRYFVKLNDAAREQMFVAERAGLEAIEHSATIRVPRVYLTGADERCSYIIMEYIELRGVVDSARLAESLAAMHACVEARFGFHCDNTIGSTPQPNDFCDDWIEFWREQRLGFQLALAAENGMPPRLIDSGARLAQDLDRLFDDYRPRASLLHGDLWSGNRGADDNGEPVIFDPACYYGDHEAELAMMELFGHPGERFFAAYRERFPIDVGYPLRRDLYNLYHLLNHANLFGGGWAGQAQGVIDRLLAQVA